MAIAATRELDYWNYIRVLFVGVNGIVEVEKGKTALVLKDHSNMEKAIERRNSKHEGNSKMT